MTFSKSVYEMVGPFDAALPNGAEDWHWVIRTVQAGAFCVRVDRKMVIYRNHRESLTAQHSEDMFLGWLQIYAQLFEGMADPQVHDCARRMTRRWLVGLLANCPEKQARLLLRQGMHAMGGDSLLHLAYLLTFLGLCPLARSGKRIKHVLERNAGNRRRIDFAAPPFSNIETASG
jgi:hypothetical protein